MIERSNLMVSAKFFAPKGRTLQAVSGVRVLKATDDKGRKLVETQDTDPASDLSSINGIESYVYTGGSRSANSTQIQLRLSLPQPDAQSIEELSAEAIAQTAGNWKEMTLSKVQGNATNEIDLTQVLPGAKIIITKLTNKNRQTRIQAQLKGPKNIKQLDLQIKSSSENFNSSLQETRFNVKGTEATRNITIQGYGFGDENSASDTAVSILVRYPEDVRRERVKFKLTALDLL